MAKMFLGLDCSTQSLSALLIDFDTKKIVYEKQLIFEKTFPQYHTVSGVIRNGNVVHSPPLMWVDAIKLLFTQMKADGVDLSRVLAISGSAQQHGSVYLNDNFAASLKTLDLNGAFTRTSAPVWMDASTTAECSEIRNAMGGASQVIEATGSDAFERFTGPQIRKFYKTEPANYAKTKTISLVSSFLASLMSGKPSPIDHGDGSGMNLMDIQKKKWHPQAMQASAPHLLEKLPPLAPSSHIIGKVNPYFTKYGLNPDALSLVWTGDNPSSLIGLGLIQEGIVGVSLGTSFTYFSSMKECHVDPQGAGNLFISPTGDYMPLNCFLNGALAIQKMRESYGFDWNAFNQSLQNTSAGNQGKLLLPYFDAEIVPKVLQPKLHRLNLDEKDAPANCRSLVEAQMMSMRLHADWMQLQPKQIYATGGVSNNPLILQILSDVHNCEVFRSDVPKSTALGAALRAAYAYFEEMSWQQITQDFTKPVPAAKPNQEAVKIYKTLIEKYKTFEQNSSQLM